MNYLHYKTDFEIAINGVSYPVYDFAVTLWTDRSASFTASSVGGEADGVANVGGAIHVICASHGLGAGVVYARLTRYIPGVGYPDGRRTVVDEFATDVTLVVSSRMAKTGGGGDEDEDEDEDDVDGGISGTLVSPFDSLLLVTEEEESYIVTEAMGLYIELINS